MSGATFRTSRAARDRRRVDGPRLTVVRGTTASPDPRSRVTRRPHPPTLDDEQPLGRARIFVGIFSFVMFAVCFTPSPIMISWSEFTASFTLR